MGRPRKNSEPQAAKEVQAAMAEPQMPIPVQVVGQSAPNPWAGKYPAWDAPVEKRKYRFVYNQNPGTPLEFTKGRSVLKGNGMPGTVHETYCLEDDNEYELPVDVAKHLNGLIYYEEGRKRPRCTCIEVD